MPNVGTQIVHLHKVFDTGEAAVTGLDSADFDIVLGKDGAAAAEAVAVAEIGATGTYVFSFTPLYAGTYSLLVQEGAFTLSKRLTFEEAWTVTTAGATFAANFANAYCALTDVERYAGEVWTATSTPADTAIAGFAVENAAELTAIVAQAGLTVAPGYSADATLVALLRKANAIGSAIAAKMAGFIGTAPNQDAINALHAEYLRLIGASEIDGLIPTYVGGIAGGGTAASSGQASTHISAEGCAQYHPASGSTESLQWNGDTRW